MGNQYHCCCIVTYGIKSINKGTVHKQFPVLLYRNCYSIFTVTPEQLQMDFQDS